MVPSAYLHTERCRPHIASIRVSRKPGIRARAGPEVRSHEVPFVLEHGQAVGRLDYEPMAEIPDILSGQHKTANYQCQGLKLSSTSGRARSLSRVQG